MSQRHSSHVAGLPDAAGVLREHPEWYHSIQLAPGLVTPGRAPLAFWEEELRALRLPPLRGKTVLDIGAYDGFFSFAAERLGAARVVALDHYAWSTDMAAYMREWRQAQETGAFVPPPHDTGHWRPEALPGRRPFDAARTVLQSAVEAMTADFMTAGVDQVGQFDVVLFLGVLYHLEEPLTALRKIHGFTAPGGCCVIETEAMEVPGSGQRALMEFFPGDELNGDASNWWAPNRAALVGLCRAAGFERVEVLPERQPLSWVRRAGKAARSAVARVPFSGVPRRLRLIVHATRGPEDARRS